MMNPDSELIQRELMAHANAFKDHPEYKIRRDAVDAMKQFLLMARQYREYQADSRQLKCQIKVIGTIS